MTRYFPAHSGLVLALLCSTLSCSSRVPAKVTPHAGDAGLPRRGEAQTSESRVAASSSVSDAGTPRVSALDSAIQGDAPAAGSGSAANWDGAGGESEVHREAGAMPPVAYANVVAVLVSGEPGSYRFAVSVESSDIDCSQFADWWEILDMTGTLVYRRIVAHSHTDANGTSDPEAPGNTFTRDGGPVAVGADQLVYVRAHITPGGYNGQVMVGRVASGFAPATNLAPDFASAAEGQEPQPEGCAF